MVSMWWSHSRTRVSLRLCACFYLRLARGRTIEEQGLLVVFVGKYLLHRRPHEHFEEEGGLPRGIWIQVYTSRSQEVTCGERDKAKTQSELLDAEEAPLPSASNGEGNSNRQVIE